MGSHVSGCQAANRLIETVIEQILPFSIAGPYASDRNGRDRSRLEFGRSDSFMIHVAQNTIGGVQTNAGKEELSSAFKTNCADALLVTAGRNGFAQSRLP
jgi:hypothetical protein